MKTIHICTLKYGNKYSYKNVNNLYTSISNHCHNFKFHCLTDDSSDLNENINVITIKENLNELIHWNKLRFYDGEFISANYGDEIIIMDIDQMFIGNSSKIINHPIKKGEHLFAYRWWTAHKHMCPINGGLQKFVYDGSQKYVLDKFMSAPSKWMMHYHLLTLQNKTTEYVRPKYGEQNFIYDNFKQSHSIKYFPKELVIKLSNDPILLDKLKQRYKKECSEELYIDGRISPSAVLVHYAGEGNDLPPLVDTSV